MKKVHLILALILLPLISGCAQNTSVDWPTEGWKTAPPEEMGIDSAALQGLLEGVDFDALGLQSLVVIRHGRIACEVYRYPYAREFRHPIYSCTKSFTATLVGIALDEGLLKSVDQKVLSFHGDRNTGKPDKRKEAMSIGDLLAMRSGINWSELGIPYTNPSNSVNLMSASPDWTEYVLSSPMLVNPGTSFDYNSGNSHLLAGILDSVTGGLESFARDRLFKPLGITGYSWQKDPRGTPSGGWGLTMTTRDLAKLGYLYLHNGEWDGRQIVSSRWVKEATRPRGKSPDDRFYGYQWWLMGGGIYAAQGYGGQYVFVIPSKNMVIATTGDIDYRRQGEIYTLLMEKIPSAAVSDKPLPENRTSAGALAAWQTRMGTEPAAEPLPLPDGILALAGKTIRFEFNPYGFVSLTLKAVRADELDWSLALDSGEAQPLVLEFTSGRDNLYREREVDVPWYRGHFENNRCFLLSRVVATGSGSVTLETRFKGITSGGFSDTVTVTGNRVTLKRVFTPYPDAITVKGSVD